MASSILTAAYIAASISIEKDVNASSRKRRPDFYGFVPLESMDRTIAIAVLALIICTCQITSKAFSFALCNVESTVVLLVYVCVDFGLMYAMKVRSREE